MLKSAVFRNITVGAVDCVVAGIVVPRTALADRIPLFHCAVEGDARKSVAPSERIIANARHAVGNCDARKSGATVERPVANARHDISVNRAWDN